MIVTVLSALATLIGMTQACALLDQTRKLRRAGSAKEVSLMFLSASLVGNVVWFAYGSLRLDPALLAVNSAGLIGGAATLITALRLRHRRPAALATGPGSPERLDLVRRPPGRSDFRAPARDALECRQRQAFRTGSGRLATTRVRNAPTGRRIARSRTPVGSRTGSTTPARSAAAATQDSSTRRRCAPAVVV